ncbi:MAG: AMP-binding protein [Gammaproteobacteria bacterium]
MEKIWLKHYPAGVPHEIDPDAHASVVALFEQSVRNFGSRPAFSNGDTTLCFSELDVLARDFGAYLQKARDIKKQDCVAIMLSNLTQFPIALLGALRIGARVTNINPLYTQDELEHQLNDAGAKAIVIHGDSLPGLQQIRRHIPIETVIIARSGDLLSAARTGEPGKGIGDQFAAALAIGKQLDLDQVPMDGEDIAFLQYTGGTTGISKGAALTHRNLIANILQFSSALGPIIERGQEIVVTALPLYHIFALTINCLAFLYLGAQNVLITDPRDMSAFVRELRKRRFSVITGVNTLFNRLLNAEGFNDLDFSALKIAIGGGAAIQHAVADKWFEHTGCPLLQGYGLSESSPLLTVNPYDTKAFSGSIGLPVPSTEIVLRDEEGHEVPLGSCGELCAKGPQVMKAYWGREEATREVMTLDGFLKTGDVARMDEKGYFYLVDRKKDLILVSGFNVYPNEVEAVVAQCEGVLESACVGVPDEQSGEAVKVFIVAKTGVRLSTEEVRGHCRERLTAYKVPKYVEFLDSLPKSTVGKILRRELRQR